MKTIASIILKYILGWRINGNYESYQNVRVNKHIICYSSNDQFNSFLIGYLMFIIYDIPVVNIINLKNFDLPVIRNIINCFKRYCDGRPNNTSSNIQILKTIPGQTAEKDSLLDQMPELVVEDSNLEYNLTQSKKKFIFLEDKINYKKSITNELSNVSDYVIMTGFKHSRLTTNLFDPEPNQGIFNIMTSIKADVELLYLDYENHTVSIHNVELKQHNRVKLFTDVITNKLKQLSSANKNCQKPSQKVFSNGGRISGIDSMVNTKHIICVKRSLLIYFPPIIVITILTHCMFTNYF